MNIPIIINRTMSELINNDIISLIAEILAQNGESRTLAKLKLVNKWAKNIKISEPLIFDHEIEDDKIFKLPITLGLNAELTIDWGDGTFEMLENKDTIFYDHKVINHKYNNIGNYRVKIWNKYPDSYIHIGYLENWADGIVDFITLGNIEISELDGMFYNCFKFNGVISDNWNTSKIVNMKNMFYRAEKFNQPLNFQTSKVTDMGFMFSHAHSFNQLLNFDTSRVGNMRFMFYGARNFNQPLNFDTLKVTDMGSMFSYANNFNQPLNFDTSNVTDMRFMFSHAHSFNQLLNFDTSRVGNMRFMFHRAESFNQPLNFDTSKVKDMKYMFMDAISFDKDKNWKPKSSTSENLDP